MKKIIPGLLVIFLITACTTNNTRNNWAYEEYERMVEPTSTGDEDYQEYESTFPVEILDSDEDGWTDNLDLCPDERSEEGLAGCAPLSINSNGLDFTNWYQLPIDPSGRINVFGNRFLVMTNYELGELQIYDLADGKLLRNFQFPDMLNDSPTLLPQGILLKNYDQQRWRLLDYSGNELFAANEELEIISESNNLLVSRADNTIFLRKLDNIKSISNSIPGRYVTFTPDGMLAITNSDACTITILNINNFTQNESYLLSPESAICYQSTQFSSNGQYIFFAEDGFTNLISTQHPDEVYTYTGIPMGQTSNSLILLDGSLLYQQVIPEGAKTQLLDASDNFVQKVIIHHSKNIAAVLTRNMEIKQSYIILIDLQNHETLTIINAESIQFTENWYSKWSFGDEYISFFDPETNQEIMKLETQPIAGLYTALDDKVFLVSGLDRQLYIYGPEIK